MTAKSLKPIIETVENERSKESKSPFRQIVPLVHATRPRQLTKNLLIYLAFFFTLGEHEAVGFGDELHLFGRVTLTFILFSLLTGATYVINDVIDARRDKLHPRKQHRPIAAGQLSPKLAITGGVVLAIAGMTFSFLLDIQYGLVAGAYLALMIAYNLMLKDMVILDVLSISGGFVLRAAAGALIIDVPISPWLYVVTSLGALMIALGKRRHELSFMRSDGADHRNVLKDYTVPFVDQLMAVVTPATVVSYTLYTFTAENLPNNNAMMLTIPFVVYGIFRYIYLVHKGNLSGSPEEIFLTDLPLIANNILWLSLASAVLLAYR